MIFRLNARSWGASKCAIRHLGPTMTACPVFLFFVRQVTHHLPEGTAPHRLHPPPLVRIDENPPLDPGSD